MANRVLRRDSASAIGTGDQVVRQVEQSADEGAVAGNNLGLLSLSISAGRHRLDDEPALRADRHDDSVLDGLCLRQPEDLSAEVLASIRIPDAAARYRPEAQMHALGSRRVHPDLKPRAGFREVGNRMRVELQGQIRLRRRVGRALPVVRAQGGLDQRAEAAQDAILVEAGHCIECLAEFVDNRLLGIGSVGECKPRIEPRLEQRNQQSDDVNVAAHGRLEVILAEPRTRLPQILRVGPQHDDLPPVKARFEDERLETVDVCPPMPRSRERVSEPVVQRLG